MLFVVRCVKQLQEKNYCKPWLFYLIKSWIDTFFKLGGKSETISCFPAKNNVGWFVLTFVSVFWSKNTTTGKVAYPTAKNEDGEYKPRWLSNFESEMRKRDNNIWK